MNKEEPILMTRQDLVRMRIDYSNTHLLELEKIGAFPARIRLSPQRVVWDYTEVMKWLNDRLSNRKAA